MSIHQKHKKHNKICGKEKSLLTDYGAPTNYVFKSTRDIIARSIFCITIQLHAKGVVGNS